MSSDKGLTWVPGATQKEVSILKTLNATEIINTCSEKSPKVSRYLYYKFVGGKEVRFFVRSKIMQFVYDKSQKLKNTAKESRDK